MGAAGFWVVRVIKGSNQFQVKGNGSVFAVLLRFVQPSQGTLLKMEHRIFLA